MKATFAVDLSSNENKAWKKDSGLYWIWIYDHSVTGAALYQLSWPANWELDIMLILYKPVKRWINDWANKPTGSWEHYVGSK